MKRMLLAGVVLAATIALAALPTASEPAHQLATERSDAPAPGGGVGGALLSSGTAAPAMLADDVGRALDVPVAPAAPAAPGAASGVVGAGLGTNSGQVNLTTTTTPQGYALSDPSHGSATVVDASQGNALIVDPDNTWNDPAQAVAVDVAYAAGVTWDFYLKTFGRSGPNNDGISPVLRVNDPQLGQEAEWRDECLCVTFGNGGDNFGPFSGLDLVGHELTHALVMRTGRLGYDGEGGALNESMADVMGVMTEFSAQNVNDPGDYLLGERFARRPGGWMRRLDDPTLDGQGIGCYTPDVSVGKNVHFVAGIGNHAFYLAAEGPGAKEIGGVQYNSPTCNGSTFTGIGRDDAARIWYEALTVYLKPAVDANGVAHGATFAGFRDATIQAASQLYGGGSAQCAATVAAWDAVTVPMGQQACAGTDVHAPPTIGSPTITGTAAPTSGIPLLSLLPNSTGATTSLLPLASTLPSSNSLVLPTPSLLPLASSLPGGALLFPTLNCKPTG